LGNITNQGVNDFRKEAIRYSALNDACSALDCQPGDLLEPSKEEKP
jgi:DNA-binding Xre family transcriptional regulator